MSQFKASVLLITFSMMMVLSFQNCARSPQIKNGENADQTSASGYIPMDAADAQTMAAPFDGVCATNLGASSGYALQADGSTISLSGGVTNARGDQLAAVQGMGDALVYGVSATSRVAQLTGVHGNIQLCGMSVSGFDNYSYGMLAVEDGAVDSVSGYHGDVVLLSGSYPINVSGFSGHIVLKTAPGVFEGRLYYGDP